MTYKGSLAVVLAAASAAVVSPTGIASGKTRFTVLGADGTQLWTTDADALSADFTGLTAAPATATAQLLDTAGTPILDPITATFVDGDAPAAAAVNVTPLASLTATYTTE